MKKELVTTGLLTGSFFHFASTGPSSGISNTSVLAIYLFTLLVVLLMYAAEWRIFVKAGQSGWKALIPFYSAYIQFKIAGLSGWWVLALMVPVLDIYAAVLLSLGTAERFGKGTIFAVLGLLVFAPIGYTYLGFGKTKYQK
jgi:hypothetical protein